VPSPPRYIVGNHRPLSSDIFDRVLGDRGIDIVPATDVLLGLARLPASKSLEAIFAFAGGRLLIIPDTHHQITVWSVRGSKGEQAAAKRALSLISGLPTRTQRFPPGTEERVDWLGSALRNEWQVD
jgi:hypothetical protein